MSYSASECTELRVLRAAFIPSRCVKNWVKPMTMIVPVPGLMKAVFAAAADTAIVELNIRQCDGRESMAMQ